MDNLTREQRIAENKYWLARGEEAAAKVRAAGGSELDAALAAIAAAFGGEMPK